MALPPITPMNIRSALVTSALTLLFVCKSPAKTIDFFNSTDGFSDTQGKNSWSYACANTKDTGDLWSNQMMLDYVPSTQTWQKLLPGGPIIKITGTQQNKFEGSGIVSLRYWTAERDYTDVVVFSELLATAPVSAFLAKVDAISHITTPLTRKFYATATSLAKSGGQQTISIETSLPSLRKGDRIYFILRNEGTGAGHGTMQTWDQTVKVEGKMLYGVHAQTKPDSLSPYLDKAFSIYAVGGSEMYVRDWWSWNALQPTSSSINWTYPDQAVAKAQALGQKLIVCLCSAPPWANGGLDRTWPATDVQLWKDFIISVVNRYKDSGVIRGWELWNEPNTPTFLEKGLVGTDTLTAWQVRADDYAQKVLIPGYAAIRSVDSFTPVLFGGMAYTGTATNGVDNSVHGFFKRVLTNAGSENSFDYAGYHPYVSTARMPSIFDQLKAEMARKGIDRPVAITEWGAVNISPATSESAANTFVQTSCIFRTKDISHACVHYSVDAEGITYGLFARNIAQPTSLSTLNKNDWRLTAYAYQYVIDQLQGYDYFGPATFANSVTADTVGYVYDSDSSPGSDKVVALWNNISTTTVEVLTGGGVQAATTVKRTGIGSTTTSVNVIGTGSNERVVLTIDANPIFLKLMY